MKTLLTAFILFGTVFHAQSQTKPLATTPAELPKKSDSQYKAGGILLGTGAAKVASEGEISLSILKIPCEEFQA